MRAGAYVGEFAVEFVERLLGRTTVVVHLLRETLKALQSEADDRASDEITYGDKKLNIHFQNIMILTLVKKKFDIYCPGEYTSTVGVNSIAPVWWNRDITLTLHGHSS